MCAQFLIKAHLKDLADLFGIQIEQALSWSERILPHQSAPVLSPAGLSLMNFSLIPSWSDSPRPKFATHNARLETISEKATWKKPFMTRHCVVPLSSFIEPIYSGALAGHMVCFNSQQLLLAAGIYDEWVNKSTGEIVTSFAIITTEPSPFVAQIGHDRQPLFIKPQRYTDWLHSTEQKKASAADFLKLLADLQETPQLSTSVDRALKKGWEKRA